MPGRVEGVRGRTGALRRRLRGPPRRGDGAGGRQRRGQVDAHQGHRGHLPLRRGPGALRGAPVDISGPATRPAWASRSSTRTWRWPTTSTWWPTCSWAASARPAHARRGAHGGARAGHPRQPVGDDPQSVRQMVAGLSGGQRQAVAVAKAVMWESKVRDPRRAHRGPGRGPDPPGARPRRAAWPTAAWRVVIISHNLHDIFEVSDRITVLRLGQLVALLDRAETDPAGSRARHHRRQLQHVPGMADAVDRGMSDPHPRRVEPRRSDGAPPRRPSC